MRTCEEAAPVVQVHANVATQHNVDLRVRLAPCQQRLALVKQLQLPLPQHLQQTLLNVSHPSKCCQESL